MDQQPLTSERAEALRAALKTLEMCHKTLELTWAIIAAPVAPIAPKPTEQEQQILDLFEPGVSMTGMQIASMLGDNPDNGSLRKRLADMVKRGLLQNRRPGGYCLPECD